nr:hypothetical protein [Tanacetum cinerariifolium]
MRALIKEEVNTQLPQILPQVVSDFANPVIEKNVTESLEAAVLTRGLETTDIKITTPSLDQKRVENKEVKQRFFQRFKTWISQVARAKEPCTSFDELMDTSFDFSAFVLNRLNIKDLTQEILVGLAFELLKGIFKSLTELEYHLKECNLHWGPKRQHFYGFAANMTSSKDVYSRKRIIAVTRLSIMKKYDYSHLEETKVRQEDQMLYKFKEEHLSDTYVFTMKMAILLEPTSNKLLKDSNFLIHSYRVVCFETFRYSIYTIKRDPEVNATELKILICYDDDDDDEDYTIATTPKEPDNSLSMGDEHLDTISTTKSDEFIKSSVENLIPNPKSLLNHDSSIISSSLKIDSLFDEFAEEFIAENSNTAFESFSSVPILVEDNDTFMEEIDLSFTPDDPMPPGIEEDDYDSKRDILILEELLGNDSFSLSKNESFHFDIPSSSRPPAKPPDGNLGILNIKMMGDISEHK